MHNDIFYISLLSITFTSINENARENYINFLEKISIDKNNSVIIYNYTSILAFLGFIKLILSYNIYIIIYLYVLYILNIFISNDIYLIIYFCLIHIPIDCYRLYLTYNENSYYIFVGLIILTFIINFCINKLDIYNLDSSHYITGISIVFAHILFNLYKETLIYINY